MNKSQRSSIVFENASRRSSWLTGLTVCLALLVVFERNLQAVSIPADLIGDWSLDLSTKEPAWLKIDQRDGTPVVYMRVHVLSAGPHKGVEIKKGRLTFPLKIKREGIQGPVTTTNTVVVGISDGNLDGLIVNETAEKPYDRITFTGKKFPPMPPRPDFVKGPVRTPDFIIQWKRSDWLEAL